MNLVRFSVLASTPGMLALAAVAYLHATVAMAHMPHPGSAPVVFDSRNVSHGEPVRLQSWWIPAEGSAPRPAVIALHGCGGLYKARRDGALHFTGRHAAMADLLHRAGYHVLMLDSFTARGKRSICQEKLGTREITTAHRRDDVLAALDWLGARSDVDASRIALLGWSHGGSTVLSAVNGENNSVARQSVMPRVAVAFYPGCSAYANGRTAYRNAVPTLILMGENDDWTPPEPCVRLVEQMDAASAPMQLRLFPDSYHDFDAPDVPVRVRQDIPNGVNPGKGVTTGGNPLAREAAYKELFEFLARAFR